MTTPLDSSLGRTVAWPQRPDPTLLFPIPRAQGRAELGLGSGLPFTGMDIWNAYELSWLDARGKPCIAIARIDVPASSPNLIESKSLKLYLGSFAASRWPDAAQLRARLAHELGAVAGAPVTVQFTAPEAFAGLQILPLDGECIDALELDIDSYGPPRPELLRADPAARTRETLVSHLLKSNCPVTGQPDWASVQIDYEGPRLDRAGLLRYLVSFRDHSGFHEQCVERIFCDILARCRPASLTVYARYTRRGGLDINPWRSTTDGRPANPRLARQ